MSCLTKLLVGTGSRVGVYRKMAYGIGSRPGDIGPGRVGHLITSFPQQTRAISMIEKVKTKQKVKRRANPE